MQGIQVAHQKGYPLSIGIELRQVAIDKGILWTGEVLQREVALQTKVLVSINAKQGTVELVERSLGFSLQLEWLIESLQSRNKGT